MNHKISVIIVSYNCKDLLIECIKSIIYSCYEQLPEIIVVDNNSTDGSQEAINKLFPDVLLIENVENVGYSAALNKGVENSSGEYLILSNADVIYLKGSIYKLVEQLHLNSNIGIMGPQQEFPDGSWQRSYGDYPSIKRGVKDLLLINPLQRFFEKKRFYKNKQKQKFVEYLDGAVLACRKSDYLKLNGFDEEFTFFSEEVDFCYRMDNSGLKALFYPDAKVVHHRGGSQDKQGMNPESIYKLVLSEYEFIKKHFSKNKAKIYLRLEKYYFKLLGSLSFLNNGSLKENMNIYVKQIKRVLNEQ